LKEMKQKMAHKMKSENGRIRDLSEEEIKEMKEQVKGGKQDD